MRSMLASSIGQPEIAAAQFDEDGIGAPIRSLPLAFSAGLAVADSATPAVGWTGASATSRFRSFH